MKITDFKTKYWNGFNNNTQKSLKCCIFQPGIKFPFFYYPTQTQEQKSYLEKATCFFNWTIILLHNEDMAIAMLKLIFF